MTVITSNLPSSTLTRGSDGWRDQVDYLVSGADKMTAITEVGVPHNTEHTSIPGIFALEFAARAQSDEPGFWVVSVTWREPDPVNFASPDPDPTPSGGTRQVGARVQPAEFNEDVNGNQIKTSRSAQPGTTGNNDQPASVEGFVPSTVLTVTRTEGTDPLNLRSFVGKVNDGTFFGEDLDKWLCTAIEGSTENNGITYTITYEFELNENTWAKTVVYIDERTGRPLLGLTEGVSIRDFRIYDRANFGQLNVD